MIQYSSGKHEKLTADPRPFVRTLDGTNPARMKAWRAAHMPSQYKNWREQNVVTRLDPRPEFDRPLANPANPILAAFRDRESASNIYALQQWAAFLRDGWDGSICEASPDEARHALAVLGRLADVHQRAALLARRRDSSAP